MDARATADTPLAATPHEPIPPEGLLDEDSVELALPLIQELYKQEDVRLKLLSEVLTSAVSGLVVVREKSSEYEETYTPLRAHEPAVAGVLRRVAEACGEQIEAIVKRSPILPIYTERTDL
jgi:hypothetical protein